MAPLYKLKVKGTMALVTIDMNKFSKGLVDKCVLQNKQATRVWLKEALLHIPGYTGTARGTFIPVGRLVGRIVKKFRAGDPLGNADRAKKKKFIHYKGSVYYAGFRSGASYAQASLTTGRTGAKIINTFKFTNNLPYVARNEASGPPPGFVMPSQPPWKALDKAAKAWRKYILTKVHKRLRYKLPRELVKIVKIRVA
jgi:hypothetical protein